MLELAAWARVEALCVKAFNRSNEGARPMGFQQGLFRG